MHIWNKIISSKLYIAVIIFIVTFALYGNSFNNEFTNWDDDSLIVNNYRIRSLDFDNILKIFDWRSGGTYQPVRELSYAVDFHFFEFNPKGYIFHSIVLHAMASVFLYLSLLNIIQEIKGLEGFSKKNVQYAAFFTALLFIAHPVNSETVVWLSGRKYVLLAFFSFLSFYLYSLGSNWDKKNGLLYLTYLTGAAGCMTLAILSSPFGVVLPAFFFLFDYATETTINPFAVIKKNFGRYLPLFCIGVLLLFKLISRLVANDSGASTGHYLENPLLTLWTMLRVLFDYIRNLVFPFFLNNRYPDIVATSMFRYKTIITLVGLIIITFFSIRLVKKGNKVAVFCIGWFLLMWLPASNIIPISTKMADRYIYLASPGLFLGFALAVAGLSERVKNGCAGKIKMGIALFIMMFLSILTINRNMVWENSGTLWADSLKKNADSFIAYNNLGVHLLYMEKDPQAALKYFHNALKLVPDNEKIKVLKNYCPALYLSNQFSDAYTCLKEYLEINPVDFNAHNQLGIICKQLGKYQEAIFQYTRAIQLKNDYVDPHYNKGICHEAMGEKAIAIKEYEKALQIQPDHFGSLLNLGNIFMSQGNLDQALSLFQKAVKINKDNPNALFNLGVVYKNMKNSDLAIHYFEETLKRIPDDKDVLFFLAQEYIIKSQFKIAMTYLEQALKIDPDFLKARQLLKQTGKEN